MKSLSDISIKNPVFAWMLMFGLLLFGVLSFNRMGVSLMPDVDFPVVSINATLEGAAPEVMESDVVDPIESALMGIAGVEGLVSNSKSGSASIKVEFNIDKNIDDAVQEIQTVLTRTMRQLPDGMELPTVSKTNSDDQPLLWISLSSSTMNRVELMTYVRDRIKDRFTTIEGVAEVDLGGFLDPNLKVVPTIEGLRKNELTVSDLVSAIRSEHSEMPSGKIESSRSIYNVRTMGEAPTPEDFSKIIINRRGGAVNYSPVILKDVAKVEDGLEDIKRKARVEGFDAVGLGIKKQRGSNAVEVARKVKEEMKLIQSTLPEGTELGIRFDMTEFIEKSVHELNFTLIISALLTALACWLFLGSWTATLNVVLAIPTSVIGTFIVLYALGFTLNTFTLLGLSLSIGIVVDDAIMVLENIVRNMENGRDRKSAAIFGSRQITLAALATTFAIIAIFFPVAFMQGIIGKFFFQFGVTISVAVLLSLLEALTLTPMRCSEFLAVAPRKTKIGKFVDDSFERLMNAYQRLIPMLLNNRIIIATISMIVFAASLSLILKLKKEFTPSQDQGRVMLRLQTKVGSSLDFTDKKVLEVENVVKNHPAVDQYFANVGGMEVNSGMIFVTMKELRDRPKSKLTNKPITQQEFSDELRDTLKDIKGIRANIFDPSGSGFSSRRGYPVEFSIQGPDWNRLVELSQQMMKDLEDTKLLTDIDSDYKSGMPEVRVIPDRTKARLYGVSISDIAETINLTIGGVVAGKFSKGGHRYDIKISLLANERENPTDILKLFVRNNRGELIPLSKLVTIKDDLGLQSITRLDRSRAITVFANLDKNASQDKVIKVINDFGKKLLPQNYYLKLGGNSQTYKDSFKGLLFALLLGLIVAYMVLASQFNSFIHPFTVFVALPFSVSGALMALYVSNQTLNIYSMIGILLLMGLVKKNSIMLVDFTNQSRRTGKDVASALIEACPLRLRPILMTSFATIIGALPPALAIGPGAETRIPMAITVIGGVLVSTVLTLFVVPVVYSLLAKIERSR